MACARARAWASVAPERVPSWPRPLALRVRLRYGFSWRGFMSERRRSIAVVDGRCSPASPDLSLRTSAACLDRRWELPLLRPMGSAHAHRHPLDLDRLPGIKRLTCPPNACLSSSSTALMGPY